MAYLRITPARGGARAIAYAVEQESHQPGIDRVLRASGNNLDPEYAKEQMEVIWNRFGKIDGSYVQAYRVIQSFPLEQLDPDNPDDVDKVNEMGLELASELFPDKQALVATQGDGESGLLHNHIIVNSVSFTDGKSLRAERTNWYHVAKMSNAVVNRHGYDTMSFEVPESRSLRKASQELSNQGKYVWETDLMDRIKAVMQEQDVHDRGAFCDRMKEEGVSVRYRFSRKKGREGELTGVSYHFDDRDGKQRKVKAKGLGKEFMIEAIDEQLKTNQEEHLKKAAAAPPKVSRREELDRLLAQITIPANEPNAATKKESEQAPKQEPSATSTESKETAPGGFEFDVAGHVELMNHRKRTTRKPREVPVEMAFRKDVEKEEVHTPALKENAYDDTLIENEKWEQDRKDEVAKRLLGQQAAEQKRRQEKRETKEKAQREAQVLKQAERERKEKEARERLEERVKNVVLVESSLTKELVDTFAEMVKEKEGKMQTTVADKSRPYTDNDLVRLSKFRIADRKKEERQQRHAPQKTVERDNDPEL
ncbi:relaxase/mobilization nuclease domain-containing protein [Alkalicoccus saliphilus]|uniref:MobA/VirD2-like nuclease domain-containing protein n=1 Tax=Alkalicoccus saliphilus TaxID=200989 RepID=A0A2T4U3Z1_9BACI|nr:relaxase/mobilization nuclease domain-containing protein [Alkalicoccus saliphilus]PTL38118.1 hypothetical protein C6Y45_13060 [Alkalicoccus saliphilus]